MSARLVFRSGIGIGGDLPAFTDAEVKNEPMLFSCDTQTTWKLGGPLTCAFLESLPRDWLADDLIIDSRVHMLMPGWYPCIPGWHLDDVPRTRPDGQPDHAHPEYKASHVMALVGDVAPTQFALGTVELEDVPVGAGIVYGRWHQDIERRIAEKDGLRATTIPSQRLVYFDWQSFHRGVPAEKNGWRWFIRATRGSKRPVTNEVRRQVQVYLPSLNGGW